MSIPYASTNPDVNITPEMKEQVQRDLDALCMVKPATPGEGDFSVFVVVPELYHTVHSESCRAAVYNPVDGWLNLTDGYLTHHIGIAKNTNN